MMIATENNQPEVVKMLIDKGVDVNAVDWVGYYTHVDVYQYGTAQAQRRTRARVSICSLQNNR